MRGVPRETPGPPAVTERRGRPDHGAPVVHEALAARGRPLEPRSRAFFEPRLGLDLGGVRVHDDALAARSAAAVQANAYTVGSDIAFAEGRYAPGTTDGRPAARP